MSHYCKICGEYKSNESFSGRGHAAHICKKCAKLPAAVRKERDIINRIDSLLFHLSKAQRKWLEGLKADEREAVRREAGCLWEMRFNREYDWVADEGVIGPSEDYPEDDLDLPF